MCYPTRCPTCGLTTWAGCGEHVESVRADVPDAQWCTCDTEVSAGVCGA